MTIDNLPPATNVPLDRNPKFRKRLAIGIAIWIFLMFVALALAIAIDWQ